MEPIRFDGPSVERGVLSRLKRLDRQLRVTFSPYAIDTSTGLPIIMDGYGERGEVLTGPCRDPAFYLWRKDPYSSHHYFVRSYPVQEGFNHLSVRHLEGDVSRHRTPAEAWRITKAMTERNAARRTAAHKQYLKDKMAANASLGLDIARGKRTTREAKAISYSGMGSHTSSAESRLISLSNRELGVEE